MTYITSTKEGMLTVKARTHVRRGRPRSIANETSTTSFLDQTLCLLHQQSLPRRPLFVSVSSFFSSHPPSSIPSMFRTMAPATSTNSPAPANSSPPPVNAVTPTIATIVCIIVAAVVGIIACALHRYAFPRLAAAHSPTAAAANTHPHHPNPDLPVRRSSSRKHLDAETVESIPIVPYKEASGQDDNDHVCPICTDRLDVGLNDGRSGQPVKQLACGHCFHPGCIEPWLLGFAVTCPLWRVSPVPFFLSRLSRGHTSVAGGISTGG